MNELLNLLITIQSTITVAKIPELLYWSYSELLYRSLVLFHLPGICSSYSAQTLTTIYSTDVKKNVDPQKRNKSVFYLKNKKNVE